ncbi:MAG: hypothetical protein N2053_08190 [Chitinispirillaceae bacterium]|nr:hypothetical protein [Chitinispirillaceae bacterium]
MKKSFDECGTPAFDNIEELLTEKIVDHSKKFSHLSQKEREGKEKCCLKKIFPFFRNKIVLFITLSLIVLIIPILIFMKLSLFKKIISCKRKK